MTLTKTYTLKKLRIMKQIFMNLLLMAVTQKTVFLWEQYMQKLLIMLTAQLNCIPISLPKYIVIPTLATLRGFLALLIWIRLM